MFDFGATMKLVKVVSWDKSVEDKIWENAFCYYKRSEEKVVYKSCEEIK